METREWDEFTLTIHEHSIDAELVPYNELLPRKEVRDIAFVYSSELQENINDRLAKIKESGSRDEQQDNLQKLGRTLYEAIFPKEIGHLFEEALRDVHDEQNLKNTHRWLRVIIDVHTTSPAFSWPLEFLFCPLTGDEAGYYLGAETEMIALSRRTVFGGRIHTTHLECQKLPLRLLVVISRPQGFGEVMSNAKLLEKISEIAGGESRDESGEEAIEVRVLGRVKDFEHNVQGISFFDKPATLPNINYQVKSWKPHVLHFIGHGDFREPEDMGYLALVKDETDELEYCSAKEISQLFTGYIPRLVLLQACHTATSATERGFMSLADYLVNRDIPAVVAMQFAITNDYAALFSEGFYEALKNGKEIDEAVQNGRGKIFWEVRWAELHYGTPVLFTYAPEAIFRPSSRKTKIPITASDYAKPITNVGTQRLDRIGICQKSIDGALSYLENDNESMVRNCISSAIKHIKNEPSLEEVLKTLKTALELFSLDTKEETKNFLEEAYKNLIPTQAFALSKASINDPKRSIVSTQVSTRRQTFSSTQQKPQIQQTPVQGWSLPKPIKALSQIFHPKASPSRSPDLRS